MRSVLEVTAPSTHAPPPPATRATGQRALLVDLNNSATFPTLGVGLLVASLRDADWNVEVLCPLAYDVDRSAVRERREFFRDHLARRIHLSTWRPFRGVRDLTRRTRSWWLNRPDSVVLRETARALEARPEVLLLSAYLRHYPTVVEIGKLAASVDVPLLIGGPMFNVANVAETWRSVPGLTAIVGGEVDVSLPGLAAAAAAGDRAELLAFDGVTLPDGTTSTAAPPFRSLEQTPLPDFTDFPWESYPFRVVPIMTGRGCQWSRCVFCSDVVSANGRSFRTRTVDSVMAEVREQAARHDTKNFVFLDLKLNSNPDMLRGIAENMQRVLPGAEWIGTVHVDLRGDNGLSPDELRAAFASGMRRISFGLESGSQRLLNDMKKGSSVQANSEFIHNAYDAGLSIRCTMFKGFPGETAEDLEQTADFLTRHTPYIDRIRFNEFAILEDTPIYETLRSNPEAYPDMRVRTVENRYARARGERSVDGTRAYRRAKARVLRAVYEINRREVRLTARAFDGLM